MKIVLASNNKGKLAELDALFAPLGVELIAQGALGIGEAEEPFRTFVENALTKARHAARESGLPEQIRVVVGAHRTQPLRHKSGVAQLLEHRGLRHQPGAQDLHRHHEQLAQQGHVLGVRALRARLLRRVRSLLDQLNG